MKSLIAFFVLFGSLTANAAKFKCYASKYPSDIEHAFEDGFVVLDINKQTINLKFYYVNPTAHETTVEVDANYQIAGIKDGKSSLKGMAIGSLIRDGSKPSDFEETIYFSPSLIENTPTSGVAGKFVFPGHGYSYDWNLCYSSK